MFSTNWINVERDKLNYEVLNVSMGSTSIIIDGWATMPHTQHFKDTSTHEYHLELISGNEVINFLGTLKNVDLTTQMDYKGRRRCNANEKNTENCNFNHRNVGFKFEIPLSQLKQDQDYEFFLKMRSKQTNKNYRIPLFYVSDGEKILRKDRLEYIIMSDFSHTTFQVFGKALFARSQGSPLSDYVYTKNYCSAAAENIGFLRYNAIFRNILGISLYDGKITYFKVRAQESGCVDNRSRLVESTTSNMYIHVPSSHVNYIGNPLKLRVRTLTSNANLFIEDTEIMQYDPYSPFDYATAIDKYDGDISSKIKITSTNVDTTVPGLYQTCYNITNSSKNTTTGCGRVTVIKRPMKKRFISKFTIHDTFLKRWNRELLKSQLTNGTPIKNEVIRKDD